MNKRKIIRMKMLDRNKNGLMAFNATIMIVRMLFLVIVLVVCVLLISLFLNQKFKTAEIHGEILIDGLIYGTGGLSYTDPVTGRVYPEIIDMAQLSGSELDAGLFFPGNRMIAARITIENEKGVPLETVYFNKEFYINWAPMAALEGVPGIGNIVSYERKLPVILKDIDGSFKSAFVDFEVLQPK